MNNLLYAIYCVIPLFSAFLFLCSSSSSFSPPCSDEVVVLWPWLSWMCPSKLWETETTQPSLKTLSRNVCRKGDGFIWGLPSFSPSLMFSDEILWPWASCMWGSVTNRCHWRHKQFHILLSSLNYTYVTVYTSPFGLNDGVSLSEFKMSKCECRLKVRVPEYRRSPHAYAGLCGTFNLSTGYTLCLIQAETAQQAPAAAFYSAN